MKIPAGKYVVAGLIIVAVMAAVVAGLVLIGSRSEERLRQMDRKRVDDLRNIAGAVDLYWTRQKRLPASLEELSQQPGLSLNIRDPGTAKPYEYHARAAGSYELCATFERDSAERSQAHGGDFWSHGAGRQCFQLEARDVGR
jgi:hypothetical protein